MTKKKKLEFQASVSDVKQISPLFSSCKVRVLYLGDNRNYSHISRDAVEKALPTIKNIPIVGEYSEENKDYKGHGGAIDLDDFKYIHTTKPYGVVPESATYEWEEVKGKDGTIREYLTIYGCFLWTGRYEEAFDVIEKGKGQSMEIEVLDGRWDDEYEVFHIDNFNFSALCILGDEVEPAFEDANIEAYSLNKDSFKQEYSLMLSELKKLSHEEEGNEMIKDLLKKYDLTIEQLTEKGIDFNTISEDELEAKIVEAFEIDNGTNEPAQTEPTQTDDPAQTEPAQEPVQEEPAKEEPAKEEPKQTEPAQTEEPDEKDQKIEALENELTSAKEDLEKLNAELTDLRDFKVNAEKSAHEAVASEMFENFQLTTEDVEGLDVHQFTAEELQEKCFAILGRKLAEKKNFAKDATGIHKLPITDNSDNQDEKPYGGLFEKFKK